MILNIKDNMKNVKVKEIKKERKIDLNTPLTE
jgi:hypothetical protein